jgi:glycosyltransferase involved in cell wall biosynthesis
MRHAAVVVAGNEYVAAHARASGARRVEVVPSVVDTRRYGVSAGSPADADQFTIGWIGSPITARYLVRLAPIFGDLCIRPGTKLRLIGAGPRLRLPDTVRVESRPWRYDDEIEALAGCDVGIMPLEDGPWEQGKCGYKLLQYMASGKPVVATPVGVNRDIVRDGENGFLATSLDEWRTALTRLRDDESLRRRLGEAGRRRVERDYSLASVAPRVTAIFRSLCGGHWAGPRP